MGAPRASALAAAYLQYASLGLRRTALHLGLFEQPEGDRILGNLRKKRAHVVKYPPERYFFISSVS
jgi:hypothetical protein